MSLFCKVPCNVTNASLGSYDGRVVATVATITSAYLNTNYPNMTIGGKVTFTNVTDLTDQVAVFTKITGTTWTSVIADVV